MENINRLLLGKYEPSYGPLYGQAIRRTNFDGTFDRWEVSNCTTMEEAQTKAFEWAIANGWTPPKWWQFWRWNDTRLPPELIGKS